MKQYFSLEKYIERMKILGQPAYDWANECDGKLILKNGRVKGTPHMSHPNWCIEKE